MSENHSTPKFGVGASAGRDEALVDRIDQLIAGDRIAELVELIGPREVGELALESPVLEQALVDALCVIQWQDADYAASRYAFFAHHGTDGEHHDRFRRACTMQASWIDVRKRAPCPEALDRLVRLAAVVPEPVQRELRDQVHRDIDRDSGPYLRFFSGFDLEEDRALVAHLRGCLGVGGSPERIPIGARGREVIDAAGAAFAAANEAQRRFRRTLFAATFIAPTVIGGAMAALLSNPEWLSLIACAVSANFWMLVLGAYKGGYRRNTRPALFELALTTGIGEAAMTHWIVDHRRQLGALDAQESHLEGDAALHLAALVHASRLGPERLRELHGEALDDPPPLTEADRVARMSDEERALHQARKGIAARQNSRRDLLILGGIFGGVAILCVVAWFAL